MWNEHLIARAIATQTLAKKCVVLVNNCSWTGHECDVLAITNNHLIIDIEIKISRADFKADAKKGKWWRNIFAGYEQYEYTSRAKYQSTPREHPNKVWKHYYAMPSDIWADDLLDFLPSKSCGVILVEKDRRGNIIASVKRRSTPSKTPYRLSDKEILDVSRLANLRMWEAYCRLAQQGQGA